MERERTRLPPITSFDFDEAPRPTSLDRERSIYGLPGFNHLFQTIAQKENEESGRRLERIDEGSLKRHKSEQTPPSPTASPLITQSSPQDDSPITLGIPISEPKEETIIPEHLEESFRSYDEPADYRQMEPFNWENNTWKHVIYNLLVSHHNSRVGIASPCTIQMRDGTLRDGFKFDPSQEPKKYLAELYASHVKHIDLPTLDTRTCNVADLYKKYLRAALQLMSKYFGKAANWTYVYDSIPLFIPNETLEEAKDRLKLIGPRKRTKDGE
eukprot:TRINITY_DN11102_c0_g1_i1.p1 TRINITY_DN11102_c0_g1~~TRINITY_DN11102_c0_g1_i1.p1  ORF type:complete len:270 (+),score=30.82 TRINITY_DN11102_c0_g1_i1:700-1509(+)